MKIICIPQISNLTEMLPQKNLQICIKYMFIILLVVHINGLDIPLVNI